MMSQLKAQTPQERQIYWFWDRPQVPVRCALHASRPGPGRPSWPPVQRYALHPCRAASKTSLFCTLPKPIYLALLLIALVVQWPSFAGVLPEDRADVLYHRYDGGGIVIQGPSVLVRKTLKDKISFSGNYYEDVISSASIDVKLSASPYEEKRKQKS